MQKKLLSEVQKNTLSTYFLCADDLQGCCSCEYEEGEALMNIGFPLENLLFVCSGRAKVSRTAPNGRDLILCYYQSSGILGDVCFASGHVSLTTTVIAVSPITAISIPAKQNEAALKNNLNFMNCFAKGLAEKLIRSTENYVQSALYTAEQRLCKYILDSSQNGFYHDVMLDTAASTSMSYRHMYRILDALCKKNIIEKTKSGYKITDIQALKKIIDFS